MNTNRLELGDDRVTVRFYAAARAAVGYSEVLVEPSTIREILKKIATGNSLAEQVFARCSILVNGELQKDYELVLIAGQEMDVLPPFAGGQN